MLLEKCNLRGDDNVPQHKMSVFRGDGGTGWGTCCELFFAGSLVGVWAEHPPHHHAPIIVVSATPPSKGLQLHLATGRRLPWRSRKVITPGPQNDHLVSVQQDIIGGSCELPWRPGYHRAGLDIICRFWRSSPWCGCHRPS